MIPFFLTGQKLIKSTELPKDLYGIWLGPQNKLIDIHPNYVIYSNWVWEYLHIIQAGDTISLVLVRKGSPSAYILNFHDVSTAQMKGYFGPTGEFRKFNLVKALPDSSYKEISPKEMPEWLLGNWVVDNHSGTHKVLKVSREGINIFQEHIYPIQKIIYLEDSWYIYAKASTGFLMYQFQPAFDGYMNIRDGVRIMKCRNVDTKVSQEEFPHNWEEISPEELPEAMLGNWSKGGDLFHAEILKEYYGTDGIAYAYKRIARRDNQYLIQLKSSGNFREKQLIFSDITGSQMNISSNNMKAKLKRLQWNENFKLMAKAELPEKYWGRYYQQKDEQALAFEVYEDKIVWKGEDYIITRLVKEWGGVSGSLYEK